MYFTFGWPKILRVPESDPPSPVTHISANRDKIIFALLTHSTLSIWTSKPCLPVVSHQRSLASIAKLGRNESLVWKPDSTGIVVVTAGGYLLFYGLGTGSKTAYEQIDPGNQKLRRESDELYLKEPIPDISIQLIKEIAVRGRVIGCVTIFRDELMVSTDENHILRYRWDGTLNTDFCIDLRRIPFSLDQQASRAIPIQESNVYPVDMQYSPLIGGFSLVLSDGRAAFLTATTKVYDPNSVQGIWSPNLDDATCCNVNHKYRLLSFGRKNSETSVFSVDDQTGGLQSLFSLKLSSRDFPGTPGPVKSMAWTPDGCAIAISWENGGFALWSVFGSLLTCSWSWTGDLSPYSQKIINSLDWAAEGYQLWIAVESNKSEQASNCPQHFSDTSANVKSASTSTLGKTFQTAGLFGLVSFVKSALTVNPSMSQIEHLYLQGEDRLLISFSGESLISSGNKGSSSGKGSGKVLKEELVNPLGNNKNWVVVPIPNTYLATNWPIRYTAMDPEGHHIAVSGRYGLAHYSIMERKWKLFGNEAQERDFVVVGGMMWWDTFLVVAVYDIREDRDELRFYPRDSKLDSRLAHVKHLHSQIMLLSLDRDKLLVFAADATLAIFQLRRDLKLENTGSTSTDPCECLQTIDISALCVHPACVISVYLTTLKTSFSSSSNPTQHSVVLNVSGRLMILHHEFLIQENNQGNAPQYITPTVLASNVEMIWLPRASTQLQSLSALAQNHNPYLSEALWLYCGQEMRVWLPLREKSQSSVHTFISNRIMLGFPVSIYPLTILFEKAIILGAENDSLSYATGSPASAEPYGAPNALFPFCILQRTSQVYLHQILRQLIRRNLGYYAWEIARSCSKLPYFPHSLELLLHEVLEEEATSKDPIPDALLPSVIEFVREFPVYLRAVGQCARKTELALWPHLFSVAGRPRALFDECLQRGQLDIAATYLLVIQNLESPTVSRKFATQLMDKALENRKWDLVKDLVRFLKAIDPSEVVEPHRASVVKFNMQTPPVSPSEYDISMVLGTMQVPRLRSMSTSVVPKFADITSQSHHRELSRTNSESKGSAPQSTSPGQSFSTSTASAAGGGGGNQGQHSPSRQNSVSNPLQSSNGNLQSDANITSSFGDSSGNIYASSAGITDSSMGLGQRPLGAVYVDAIVEKHARRILAEGKLRDLGKLAAHLDFHLVTWLRRERGRRPLMVTDFVAALKMIHSEFEWPYPDFVSPPYHHSRTPSNDSVQFPIPLEGTSATTSPLKPLSVDVLGHRIGTGSKNGVDSGYNSIPGNQAVEAHLLPHSSTGLDLDTLSIVSEDSVMVDHVSMASSDLIPMFGLSDASKISFINSSKCGVELRFMQQIMWEAGLLDWSLLISVALRDALGVVRTVNSSRDQSPDSIRSLREGLVNLNSWANTQCMGYRTFINAVNTQVGGLLAKLLSAATYIHGSPNSGNATHPCAGEFNRRKTEPVLSQSLNMKRSHSEVTPPISSTNSSSNVKSTGSSNGPCSRTSISHSNTLEDCGRDDAFATNTSSNEDTSSSSDNVENKPKGSDTNSTTQGVGNEVINSNNNSVEVDESQNRSCLIV